MDLKVSIIIPVYNAEKYLRNCIESIINQEYKSFELILVNDGSTDSSGLICDKYAERDNRIKVIHQRNAGPSIARNKGINFAKGEYIQFVDSDDSIEANMTTKLVQSMNDNVQLAICGYKTIRNNNRKVLTYSSFPICGKYEDKEFIKHFGVLFRNNFINPVWNKLYVTEIIKKNNLQFINGLNMGEDLLFNLEYLKVCKYINILDESLYNYIILNNDSITGSFKHNLFENQEILFQNVRGFLLGNDSYYGSNKEQVEITFTNRIIGCFNNIFHNNSNLEPNEIKEMVSKIINNHTVRREISYFKQGNFQKKIVGYLIKIKSIRVIHWFFKTKSFFHSIKQKSIILYKLIF